MTAHSHAERVAGCYRCEISADEVPTDYELARAAMTPAVPCDCYWKEPHTTYGCDYEERAAVPVDAAMELAARVFARGADGGTPQ